MIQQGRPLRFLLLVMGGWIGLRTVMLWPVAPIAAARSQAVARKPATITIVSNGAPAGRSEMRDAGRSPVMAPIGVMALRSATPISDAPQSAVLPMPSGPPPDRWSGIIAGLPIVAPRAPEKARSRLFGSAWLVARGGRGPAGGVPGAQLGGSQAGMRLAYALRADRRLALALRVSAPLQRGMREAALGLEWQPTRLPVRLVAEQRVAIGRGRGGPTLAAVGGIGPRGVGAGFGVEAYVQGGVIGRGGGEGFADGAVRVARPLATLGKVRFDLGGSGWGAAQRGAARLDVGPSLSARLSLGRQPMRLSLDWRERVAGDASPGSGVVLTLGADF